MTATKSLPSIVLDLTMNLANRTAVHEMGHEIYGISEKRFRVRYWRLFCHKPIDFTKSRLISNAGKAISRIAFKDVASNRGPQWPRRKRDKILFLEPLFSLKTPIDRDDIIVCHDIAPISHPQYYMAGTRECYHQAYLRIMHAAPLIVFVSDFTKKAFLEYYPANYRGVEVIPLYSKYSSGHINASVARARPFMLMVGTLERRKNYRAALEAFRESRLTDEGFDLVIVGPRGNLSAELLPNLNQYGSVEHLGFAEEASLNALYRSATALFFPSLIEGFGVPALEAPQLGLMPIVSRGTILEEIAGPDGILVDPLSVPSMAAGLREAASMDAESRKVRLSRIKEHQRVYSLANFRAAWSALLERE